MEEIKDCLFCHGLGCPKCDHLGVAGGVRCGECHGGIIIFINEKKQIEGKICRKCDGKGWYLREGGGRNEICY